MLTGGIVQNYRNFGGGACGAEYFCCIFAFFQSLQSHTFLFGHCASTYKHWVTEGSVHSHSQKWPYFMCQWTNLPKLCGIKTVVEMQTTTGWKNCVVLWKVVPGTQSSRRFGVKTWLWSGKKKLFFFFFLLKMKKRTVETGQLYFGSLQYINTQLNYYYFSSLYEFFSNFLHQTKHYSPRHLSQWLNDVQGILFL